MNKGLSPSRQMWNRVMTALVWASAVLVMVLVAGIIGMVLVPLSPAIGLIVAGCGIGGASPTSAGNSFPPPPVC